MLNFELETFRDDVIEEMEQLVLEHWKEVGGSETKPVVVWDVYQKAEGLGLVKLFTARDSGVLVGYGVFSLAPDIHHGNELKAIQDVFYLAKDSRKGYAGLEFIRFCDEMLVGMGAKKIRHEVTEANNWGAVLEYIGYSKKSTIYEKGV